MTADPNGEELVESSTDSDFDEVLDAAIILKDSPGRHMICAEDLALPSFNDRYTPSVNVILQEIF